MAEFASAEGGHTSGGKKGKMSKNQKMLFYGGGLAVIGFFLIMARGRGGGSSSASTEEEIPDYLTNYPTLGPQNALMQDGMNTLIGHQEEMLNSLLEATGKKDPDIIGHLKTGEYQDINRVMELQRMMIKQGVESTRINSFYDEKGFNGAGWYYNIEGWAKDKEVTQKVASNNLGKTWWRVESDTQESKNSVVTGSHVMNQIKQGESILGVKVKAGD